MITINLSEKDFNKIADIIEQRILYYHSLAMNARIVDDEKQFLKQMKKVSFYTRLKTVFFGRKNLDCTVKYWLEYENGTFTKKGWL